MTPSALACARIHGSQATRTAARRLPGPSGEVSAGLRIAAVTITGISRSSNRSSRKLVSSSVSVPCVTTTPSALSDPIRAASAWIWSKASEWLPTRDTVSASISAIAASSGTAATRSSAPSPICMAPDASGRVAMVPPSARMWMRGLLTRPASAT